MFNRNNFATHRLIEFYDDNDDISTNKIIKKTFVVICECKCSIKITKQTQKNTNYEELIRLNVKNAI